MLLKRMGHMLCTVVMVSAIIAGGLAPKLLWAKAPSAEPPSVVVSIKPVHSLISSVMAGIGTPHILISGGASPHAHSLRPSKARLLSKADIIFWVGDEMETFLEKPLRSLGHKATIIELSKASGVRLLKARASGTWETHSHEEEHHHDHDDRHSKESAKHKDDKMHGKYNMHMWLGRGNAKAIVRAAVKTLIKLNAANASRYKRNGDRTIDKIEKEYRILKQDLTLVKHVPYLVFHDAYPYFERDMGLNAVGSISTHTARKPGAKRLYQIRRKILTLGVKCIFAEPQFEPALIKTMIQGTSAKTGILDPIGATLKSGPDAYFILLRNLTKNLKACLSKTS